MMKQLYLITVLLFCISSVGIKQSFAENFDKDNLVKEITKLARPGMPVAEAVANLKSAGYQCGKSQFTIDDPKAILCSHQYSYRVLATCVQQILLVPDSNIVVERLDIREPKCTGL
ncbi:hypothetical protein [Acinetobacter pittii]|uniref:hypothetical protein n=1 Tax=Acinetobacter pittii TaxID=48296 RepID=UPI00192C7768|nr:hypothetical protein [Acinetobacter pittii]